MSKKRTSRFGANVVADVEKRKRESSGFGYLMLPKGLDIFKEEEGKVKLDIIPYIVSDPLHLDRNADDDFAANVGNPWYKKPIWVHRGVGADRQSIVCPAKTIGKKCPICEYREKQKAEGVDKEDMVSYPQLRNLYVVIPIGHKKYDEKYHLWDIANGNFQKHLDEELGENPENGVFPDPEEGKTLFIRFTEEKFGKNKYQAASRIDFEEREAYEESVMDKAPNLDDMVKILSYKEIEAMFLEIDEEDVAEDKPKKKSKEEEESPFEAPRRKKTVKAEPEEEESASTPKKRKPAPDPEEEEEEVEEEEEPTPRRRRPKPEPEEEPEDEDEEDEEEEEEEVEEEERPSRRRTAKKEEPEDEDEDEEEEEEDEAPRKKRRGSR